MDWLPTLENEYTGVTNDLDRKATFVMEEFDCIAFNEMDLSTNIYICTLYISDFVSTIP